MTTKTPVQEALINLRVKLGLTQQDVADALDVTQISVCRWETCRPPSGWSLAMLANWAREEKAEEVAQVFEQALERAAGPHRRPNWGSRRDQFAQILKRLERIEAKLDRLSERKADALEQRIA